MSDTLHETYSPRAFPLATVLTITTGRLLCPMADVYVILNHLTGDELYTHQLPRVMEECRPWLLRWVPSLAQVPLAPLDALIQAQGNEAGVQAYLDALCGGAYGAFPATITLGQIPRDAHTVCDPLQELVDRVGPERVIVVRPSLEDAQ